MDRTGGKTKDKQNTTGHQDTAKHSAHYREEHYNSLLPFFFLAFATPYFRAWSLSVSGQWLHKRNPVHDPRSSLVDIRLGKRWERAPTRW